MDDASTAALAVLMRWVHISTMAIMVGGLLYARFAIAPALATLADSERQKLNGPIAAGAKPWLIAAVAGSLLSGIYNFVTKAAFPPHYHMWFGIKMLLVLHIYAVCLILATGSADEVKRNRLTKGVALSGFAVLAISAVLRYLTLTIK